ncbi:MAG: tripartite tricarboxylate transporter substrate binding protein [Rhodoferax sp.]|nr:tripartite tricarboxylate transporter substrate binding protein [Rhodoferax sp.]
MILRFTTRLAGLLALGMAAGIGTLASPASAQGFPTQPVRIISPFPAGSGPDAIARIVGERLTAAWKQPVIVDVRPGANGFIAIGAAKQAPPTGHDLLLADVGHLAISPSLFKKLPYDPKADFLPVGGVYRTSFFIAVAANSPIHSVKDLVAAAAVPGKLTYGSNSIGGPLHLGAAQVEAATGTTMTHVAYKEITQLYTAVSTGEVDWAMGSIASAGPMLRAGRLRFVAIADTQRSSAMPDVPTFQEAGGAKPIQARTWVALLAPKGTPPAVIATLNRSLNDVLGQREVGEKFASFGFVPDPTTPADLAALITQDTAAYAEMVKRTGANAD